MNVTPMIGRIKASTQTPTENLFIIILCSQGENNAVENTTKYNGDIFRLTELDEYGNHGDIIKYLEENKLNTEQLQNVLLALVRGLRGHI